MPLIFLMIVGMAEFAWSRPVGLSGNWQYRERGNGETEESFEQNYNIDLGYDLTELLSFNGSLRYNRVWNEGDVTELITPILGFDVRNDIFNLNLAATAVERRDSEGPDYMSKSWEANWTSNWDKPLWPGLRFFFGQSEAYDDQSPKQQDIDSYHYGTDLNWEYNIVEVLYSFYYQDSKDHVSDTETKNTRHFVRGEVSKSFLDDRLNLSLSQQYSYYNYKTIVQIGASGTAQVSVPISAYAYSYDTLDEDYETGIGPNISTLTNDDTTDAAYTIDTTVHYNYINLNTNYRKLDIIYIYTSEDISSLNPNSFTWYIATYTTSWDTFQTISFNYNSTEHRFEFQVSGIRQARYIKLATDSFYGLSDTYYFSEVEVSEEVSGQGEVTLSRTYNNYITDGSVNFSPIDVLDFNYSFSYEYGNFSDGPDTERLSQVGSARWSILSNLTSTFSVSETRQDDEGEPETITRSYAISTIYIPLPTLDVSLGITKNDNYEGGDKTSTTYNYTLYTTAALFPDLDSSLDLTYTNSENYESDTSTDTYTARLTFTARLTPALTVDMNTNYNSTHGTTDADTVDANLNMSWRPSDILSLRSTLYSRWVSDGDDSKGLNLSMGLATTEKTQLNLTYSYADSTTTTQNFGMFWSWTISRYLSVQVNGSYQIREEEDNPWMINTQLTARFAGFD